MEERVIKFPLLFFCRRKKKELYDFSYNNSGLSPILSLNSLALISFTSLVLLI